MSFEERINHIQSKPRHERKTIALVTTVVLFVLVMIILYFLGGFSLPNTTVSDSMSASSTATSSPSISKEFGAVMDEFEEQFETLTASSSELLEDLQAITSTTSTSTSNTIDMPQETTSELTAATSSDDVE